VVVAVVAGLIRLVILVVAVKWTLWGLNFNYGYIT